MSCKIVISSYELDKIYTSLKSKNKFKKYVKISARVLHFQKFNFWN